MTKYCDFNGCTNKISHGKYCEEHQRSAKSKRARRKKKDIYHHDNKPFYRTEAWKSVSDYVYEREHGCCQRCGKFIFGRQAHRHHIVPIKDDKTLALDPNNIMLLCPQCHVIVENEDKDKKDKVYPSYFKTAEKDR